jgi:curved DNA-binding protein CbpA
VVNYYEVLGVNPESSVQDIKKSFRRKAKEFHPDLNESEQTLEDEMRILITAYEVLINPQKREEYDRNLRLHLRPFRFDYRDYLRTRKHDLFSQSKLIFYDLLNDHAGEALELYEDLIALPNYQLENYLTREDYMDCAFLLAEAFEARGDLARAYRLYKQVYIFEVQAPYFRHFADEVVDRLRNLVCFKMIRIVPHGTIIAYLKELIRFDFSKKDTSFFYKKIAEIYSNMGDNDTAVYYLSKALEINGKLSGVKKLKEKIGFDPVVQH